MTAGAHRVARRVASGLFDALVLAAMLLVLAGTGVLLWQAALWPWDGRWTPLELRLAWAVLGGGESAAAPPGVRRLALAVLSMPLGVGLVLAGWAASLAAGWTVWVARLGPHAPAPPSRWPSLPGEGPDGTELKQ